jgi:hypothetical protein
MFALSFIGSEVQNLTNLGILLRIFRLEQKAGLKSDDAQKYTAPWWRIF